MIDPNAPACEYCGEVHELRPYGKRGENICFSCAMKPENKADTEAAFAVQLNAVPGVAVIGRPEGPIPRSACIATLNERSGS